VPQSLANVTIHLVFSTKNRTPSLSSPIRSELLPYTGGILRNIGCNPIQIGGVEDHIRLLFNLSRTLTIAQVVEKVKTSTSKWLQTKGLEDFAWQHGYGAFSVSVRETSQVTAYIQNQEFHHGEIPFQTEYRELLRDHGVEVDER
jgi:REP element-mobilizing transposase RayT